MVADYEAAWVELGALVASREGWGSKTLSAEMAKILAKYRVSETQVERVLRLYGGSVSVVMSTSEASAYGTGGNDEAVVPTAPAPTPPSSEDPKGDRDGSYSEDHQLARA